MQSSKDTVPYSAGAIINANQFLKYLECLNKIYKSFKVVVLAVWHANLPSNVKILIGQCFKIKTIFITKLFDNHCHSLG